MPNGDHGYKGPALFPDQHKVVDVLIKYHDLVVAADGLAEAILILHQPHGRRDTDRFCQLTGTHNISAEVVCELAKEFRKRVKR